MKALSIRQPYAFAIAAGYKPIENRDWRTGYRGFFLIHAGLKEDRDDVEGVLRRCSAIANLPLSSVVYQYRKSGHRGGIVGSGYITDCVSTHESQWFNGPFGFVIVDAQPTKFVPCVGRLGWITVPANVQKELGL